MTTPNVESHELKCMEIWSGHRSVENNAVSEGLRHGYSANLIRVNRTVAMSIICRYALEASSLGWSWLMSLATEVK